MHSRRAFTVVEMLVVVALLMLGGAFVAGAGWKVYEESSLVTSANNIRQLAAGGAAYLADHQHRFWKFREDSAEGTRWWWGFESRASQRSGEGNRRFSPEGGPLGGYVPAGARPDPSFALHSSALKPKYRSGYIGVGYNVVLGGGFFGTRAKPLTPIRYWELEKPSQVVVFSTSAQVNTFQRPASPGRPMLEEFYGFDDRETTIHFRHHGKAMVGFADGSVGFLPIFEPTRDPRMPDANIGRFAPRGSFKYLK